jgi:hypothetical protein
MPPPPIGGASSLILPKDSSSWPRELKGALQLAGHIRTSVLGNVTRTIRKNVHRKNHLNLLTFGAIRELG